MTMIMTMIMIKTKTTTMMKTNPGSRLLSIGGELAQWVTMLTSACMITMIMMVVLDGGDDNDDHSENFSLNEKVPFHHPDHRHCHRTHFSFPARRDLELGESLIPSISASVEVEQVSRHFRRLFERFPSTSSFAGRTNDFCSNCHHLF